MRKLEASTGSKVQDRADCTQGGLEARNMLDCLDTHLVAAKITRPLAIGERPCIKPEEELAAQSVGHVASDEVVLLQGSQTNSVA